MWEVMILIQVGKFVKKQIPEICLEAVKQNGWALKYVEDEFEEACLKARNQSQNKSNSAV